MAKGKVCTCPGDFATRARNWTVTHFKVNHSSYNAYRATPSDHSELICAGCGCKWRTNAAYVDDVQRGRWRPRVTPASLAATALGGLRQMELMETRDPEAPTLERQREDFPADELRDAAPPAPGLLDRVRTAFAGLFKRKAKFYHT